MSNYNQRLDFDDLEVMSFDVTEVGAEDLMGLSMGHGTTEVGASCYCFPPYCCCASCCAAADEIEQGELTDLTTLTGPTPDTTPGV